MVRIRMNNALLEICNADAQTWVDIVKREVSGFENADSCYCCAKHPYTFAGIYHYECVRAPGHQGPHISTGGPEAEDLCAIWEKEE